MNLLAIDTSGDMLSVALASATAAHDYHRQARRQQTALVLPVVDQLCRAAGICAADLHGVVVGIGPGSFTGVRVACAVAQGIATAHELPVVAVSSLAALALETSVVYAAQRVLVCNDARRGQVYFGWYERTATHDLRPLAAEGVGAASTLKVPCAGTWWVVGTGVNDHLDDLRAVLGLQARLRPHPQCAHARYLLQLGRTRLKAGYGVAATDITPTYLRAGL